MALEIREMILRTTLVDPPANNSEKQHTDQSPSAIDTEFIIAECLERLTAWLREENER